MKKYYEEISMLRGITILLVLLGHSIIFFPINLLDYNWCSILYDYIYYFHMPMFFLISGFCYSKKKFKDHFISKVKRILIPYFAFSMLDLIPRYLFPSLINGNQDILTLLKQILLNGGKIWFLYALFIMFMIYPLIEKIIKNKFSMIISIILLVVINSFNITDMFLINKIVKFLPYFILGNYLKQIYSDKILKACGKPIIVITSIISFILLGLLPSSSICSFIKAIAGIVMTYSIIVSIKNIKIRKLLKNFGDYSLQLYLLNGFMLVPARVITVNVLHISNPLLIISIICISNALIGILVAKYILDRYKITRVISGIKVN